MKLAVISEAKYENFRRGSLEWYLKEFFQHQPDAYDEAGLRYYHVKPEFDIYLDNVKISAIELDTFNSKEYGTRLTRIKAWRSNGTPMRENYLHNFGEVIEIHETRKVDLPQWISPDG